jgi:hypothetical protein
MVKKAASVRFHTNVHRTWKTAVRDCQADLRVFSPYLTSRVAESVMGDAATEVHTVFDVENFASGASSLRTLRALIEAGHALFHLPGLHAKLVLDRQGFASVGSQNITHGGTRRLEITATFHTPDAASEVRARVEPWLKDRVPITLEMIEEMERLFEPAKILFEQAQVRAAELQVKFQAIMDARAKAEAERLERDAEERRQLADALAIRLSGLRQDIARRKRSNNEAYAWVQRQDSGNYVHSLVTFSDVDLTRWLVDGRTFDLQPLHRYLCIVEETGMLGWARVGRTRITYIAPELRLSRGLIQIEPTSYGLEFVAVEPRLNAGANLIIRLLAWDAYVACEVAAWYSPGALLILDIRDGNAHFVSRVEMAAACRWLQENTHRFSEVVRSQMVAPFKYEANLTGGEANKFFGEQVLKLRLMIEESSPVFVASSLEDS